MLENKTRGGIQKKISIHPTKPDKGALKRSKHYIFLLKSGENGNLHLFFLFFYQISTGGQPAQSETTKVPSRGKAPLLMKQRSLAAPFWAVRAQQGGFSENCPAFSRPRAVWQLLRL